MLKTISIQTGPGENLVNLTEALQQAVVESGVREGLCVVFVPHTTAALIVNSGMDPKTADDIIADLRRLVPTRVDFHHIYDTPADAAGHIKASMVGGSQALIVHEGKIWLGGSQSVLFYECDGPRKRQVWLRILADQDSQER